MRTTVNLDDDSFVAARNLAQRERMSLGRAISQLIRQGSQAGVVRAVDVPPPALKGRFALLPARDEVITPQHVRALMEREGI
jgi:hypothetical protein